MMADISFKPIETGTQPLLPIPPAAREKHRDQRSSHQNAPEKPKKGPDSDHQIDEFA